MLNIHWYLEEFFFRFTRASLPFGKRLVFVRACYLDESYTNLPAKVMCLLCLTNISPYVQTHSVSVRRPSSLYSDFKMKKSARHLLIMLL